MISILGFSFIFMKFSKQKLGIKGFFFYIYFVALICSRLGLLKNKPRVITYQMQIDGQKVLASFL